jgi:hypothetical protein
MNDWLREAEPYVRDRITDALGVVARATTEGERIAAAKIVRALVGSFLHHRLDETITTDIMTVLARRLDDGPVVRHLLRALVIGAPEAGKLTVALERLAGRAAEGGLRESLWHLVCRMLEVPAWRERVCEEWARDALALVTDSSPTCPVSAERLIRAWLDLHSTVPEWMAPTVEQRPDLLMSPHMPSRWVWPLHAAAPTTQGWHLLAGLANHKYQPLDAAAFGPQLDVALETLDRALVEERDTARRVALAGWLVELGGQL